MLFSDNETSFWVIKLIDSKRTFPQVAEKLATRNVHSLRSDAAQRYALQFLLWL
jgi:hypothetical protein